MSKKVQKKDYLLSPARLRAMGVDLFSKIEYDLRKDRITKTEAKNKMIDRHVQYLDMLPPGSKIDPVKWVKKLVRRQGKDHAKKMLVDTITNLSQKNAYTNTNWGRRSLVFYKNAMGYYQNHFL